MLVATFSRHGQAMAAEGAVAWLRVLGVGFAAFVVVEIEKWIRLRAGADDGTGIRGHPVE